MEVFEDRRDAGRRLAGVLADHPALSGDRRIVVLAIPRGGLPVGVEVARVLGAEVDVSVIRKLRSPHNPELGLGAVGPGGQVEIDQELVDRLGVTAEQLDAEIADRRAEVVRRLQLYREVAKEVDMHGVVAVVVDDGIATGGTARQACVMARQAGAAVVVLAAPVGPVGCAAALADVADAVVVLETPAEFMAVGQVYRDFAQLDDQDSLAALRQLIDGKDAEPAPVPKA